MAEFLAFILIFFPGILIVGCAVDGFQKYFPNEYERFSKWLGFSTDEYWEDEE